MRPSRSSVCGTVEIRRNSVQQPGALAKPALERAPFSRRDDHRQHVERPRPRRAAIGRVDVVGDAVLVDLPRDALVRLRAGGRVQVLSEANVFHSGRSVPSAPAVRRSAPGERRSRAAAPTAWREQLRPGVRGWIGHRTLVRHPLMSCAADQGYTGTRGNASVPSRSPPGVCATRLNRARRRLSASKLLIG